jgi:hypothetical protein
MTTKPARDRAPNGLIRLALNFVVYLVLGGGVLSFVALRSPEPPTTLNVLLAALAVAAWSGGLTTVNEVIVVRRRRQGQRAALAAAVGALSLGGFASLLSFIAWGAPAWGFIAIGVLAGGLMQGARAFSAGQRPAEPLGAEEADEPDGLGGPSAP